MSTQKSERIQQLLIQLRFVSANSVVMSQIVASKAGLHPTDVEGLDYLLLNGASAAGQLAKYMGLTTGAVTAMVDRLEKGGFVQRIHDLKDRRKVIISPHTEKIYAEVTPHIASMGQAIEKLCETMPDAELVVIVKFLTAANTLASDFIERS